MWIESNEALSTSQMENNAIEMYNYFHPLGFTLESICGMLGNMWRESTVNPGVWQNFKVNYDLGFGLVQWTPARNFISWCQQNGLQYDTGETQCYRIKYEYDNGLQYYKTSTYPLTFPQFSQSVETPEYLAEAFFYNYERGDPAQADMAGRKKWARYFYEYLGQGGETPVEPDPDPGVPLPPAPAPKPKSNRRALLLLIGSDKSRRKRG